ncbi:MAG: hypothetical protein ACK5PB_11740 [Pirellula sp.]|jgi:hypothetical protein
MNFLKPLSKRMIELLEEQRDACNENFRFHVSQGARLDPTLWFQHVRKRLAPIVDAVDEYLPERSRIVLTELYDISLDLFAIGHLSEEGSSLPLLRVWEELLPNLSKVIARDPRRVVGCLCNAVLNISQSDAQTAHYWIDVMKIAGPNTDSVDQLLAIGKFAAWRAGQSEYRLAALNIAENLPAQLLAQILGPAYSVNESEVHALVRCMEKNPWRLSHSGQEHGIRLACTGGQFVGYGGLFFHPPMVYVIDGNLCVTDRKIVWRIDADSFGFRLHKVELAPENLPPQKKSQAAKVTIDGKITWDDQILLRPDLANSTSYACDGTTLAVTIPSSFHVFLFSRAARDRN